MNEKNLLERSFHVFEEVQRRQGNGSVDEVSFVGGFMTCFGILSGRVEIGLLPGSTVLELFEQIQRELDAMRCGVIIEQENARLRDD